MTESQDPVACQICGRDLKTPESRLRGRGPTCDEKVSPTGHPAGRGRDHSPRTRRAAPPAGSEPTLLDELPSGEPQP